jgi:uncharacterized membrane protein YoaK (UPF0700 family)
VRDLRRRDLLLVALTFAAGSVDAVALLRLDVFTAVMTGNIVLLGLAVGQGAFRSALRSLLALVAYSVGVIAGARIVGAVALETHWSPKVTAALAVEWALQAAFLVSWLLTGGNPEGAGAGALIAFSGVAMGMSTTYITGTITGLLSELSALGAVSGDRGRRASIVIALVMGAIAGAFALATVPAVAPAIPLVVVGGVLVAETRFR